jgi:hypothetical protein
MAKRLELHQILVDILGDENRVYFQPPSNIQMSYPCILYNRDNAHTNFADDSPYRYTQRYLVTLVDRDPDSPIFDKIKALPLCVFSRHFASENLNHDAFSLYY